MRARAAGDRFPLAAAHQDQAAGHEQAGDRLAWRWCGPHTPHQTAISAI